MYLVQVHLKLFKQYSYLHVGKYTYVHYTRAEICLVLALHQNLNHSVILYAYSFDSSASLNENSRGGNEKQEKLGRLVFQK